MNRSGGIALVFATVAVIAAPVASASPTPTRSVLDALNAARAQHHLGPLRLSTALDRSAQLKAAKIERCNSFSHTPCGLSFRVTFRESGYLRGPGRVGENLYWGTGSLGSTSNAINAWLNSPPHRANMLGRWRDAGISIVHAPSLFGMSDVWLFVLQFGRSG